MKYYVMHIKAFAETVKLITEDKTEAVKVAQVCDQLIHKNNEHGYIEIRKYFEDIEDENCTCLAYNTIEF